MARTKPAVVANKEDSQMLQLRVASELIARSRYASLLGLSFGDKRDIYQALGYSKQLLWSDLWNMFRRGRLGKRVISAPVDSTWRGNVTIMEDNKPEETEFEKAWKALNKKLKIIPKLGRADKLSRIGEFGVLLLGFSDGKPLDQPLEGTKLELIYLQPYHYGNIEIMEWEVDVKNPRYGLPKIYSLEIRMVSSGSINPSSTKMRVHYTRVIHIAEGLLDNDVSGTPAFESSYNTLQDLEKIAGGSAEMYWQGALGGRAFTAKDGATLDKPSRDDMQKEIDEYVHGLRRYMRLQNIDVQNLDPQISDPGAAIQAQIDILSGDTGIPKRILIGSERGELASVQDESNWLNRVKERQEQYAEPYIIRPVVDLLIKVGALPSPKTGEYQVSWPDLWDSSDKEKAESAKTKAEAIATYLSAPGAEQVMPVDFFFKEILKLTDEQVDQINKMLQEEPPPTPEEQAVAMQEALRKAGGGGNQQGNQPNDVQQQGGKVSGKKSQVVGNEEDVVHEFIRNENGDVVRNPNWIGNFNPNHDAHSGEFTSSASSSTADSEARTLAAGRGYRVPPAWKSVWVNPDVNADLQVKGIDSKGRTQRIYSANATSRNSAAKFARLKSFTNDYPEIMTNIKSDMLHSSHSEEAKVLYLISQTGFRIGGDSDTRAEKQAFGASTLLANHVSVSGNKVTFNFTGKKGVVQNHVVEDHVIAGMFQGKSSGKVFNTTPDKVREYLHSISSKDYKVKDFRTYVATGTALQIISTISKPTSASAKTKAINQVAKLVSEKLGNTPAMAKNAYIDPIVFKSWDR